MARALAFLQKLEEIVLAGGLLGLAGLAFVEVVSRYLFNHSFTWFEEFARYFCVFLTFLGASLGVKRGMHFAMDYVVTRVSPGLARVMRLVGALLPAVLFGAIAWLAWEHALKLHRFGTTSAAMGLPMMWAYLPVSLFSATLALRLLAQAWASVRGPEAKA